MNDYDWDEYPAHECEFLVDNTVRVGLLEDGVLRQYDYTICNQCPNTQMVRTDREEIPPQK